MKLIPTHQSSLASNPMVSWSTPWPNVLSPVKNTQETVDLPVLLPLSRSLGLSSYLTMVAPRLQDSWNGWNSAARHWKNVPDFQSPLHSHYHNTDTGRKKNRKQNTGSCSLEIMQLFALAQLYLDNWLGNIRQLFLKTNYSSL